MGQNYLFQNDIFWAFENDFRSTRPFYMHSNRHHTTKLLPPLPTSPPLPTPLPLIPVTNGATAPLLPQHHHGFLTNTDTTAILSRLLLTSLQQHLTTELLHCTIYRYHQDCGGPSPSCHRQVRHQPPPTRHQPPVTATNRLTHVTIPPPTRHHTAAQAVLTFLLPAYPDASSNLLKICACCRSVWSAHPLDSNAFDKYLLGTRTTSQASPWLKISC